MTSLSKRFCKYFIWNQGFHQSDRKKIKLIIERLEVTLKKIPLPFCPNSIIDFKARQFFNTYNKDVLANFGGSNSWSIGGDWERTRLRELLIRDLLLSEFMRFGTYCICSLLWRATVCARNKRIC